jgi:hypothetical protein
MYPVVIARLDDRATQYSSAYDGSEMLRCAGYPAFARYDGEYWSIRNPDERSDMREALVPDVAEPVIERAFARPVGSSRLRLYRGDEEAAYSPFSFDMRSRRSCMSLIWRRSSSMLPSSAAGSGAFSDSAPAEPLRGGENGLNIEKVC